MVSLKPVGARASAPATLVACGLCLLVTLGFAGQANGATKHLRLSPLTPYGSKSKFTAWAPKRWNIKNPRTSCAAWGVGSGGSKRRAYVLRAGGRSVTFAFRDTGVGAPLVVDCRKLRKVVVHTKIIKKWVYRSSSRRGADASETDRKGNCHIDRLFGDLTVDCWGGRYAEAVYKFNLPGDARHINRSAHGSVQCCDRGHLSKGWVDKGGNDLAYRVVVTGWRAYTIKHVGVSYRTKVKRRVRVKHVKRATGHGVRR